MNSNNSKCFQCSQGGICPNLEKFKSTQCLYCNKGTCTAKHTVKSLNVSNLVQQVTTTKRSSSPIRRSNIVKKISVEDKLTEVEEKLTEVIIKHKFVSCKICRAFIPEELVLDCPSCAMTQDEQCDNDVEREQFICEACECETSELLEGFCFKCFDECYNI